MTAVIPLRKRHPRRDGAKRPIGRLYGGDLRLKCTHCDRSLVPFDIVLAEDDIITIDCTCGERSQIWMTPVLCADA
jgi:hypothetical protein